MESEQFTNGKKTLTDSLGYRWRIANDCNGHRVIKCCGDPTPDGGYFCDTFAEGEALLVEYEYLEQGAEAPGV